MDRTTNLLGAAALAITDRIRDEMQGMLNRSGETAAALVVLGYVPGLSIEPLRQVLGLSHPGTVRLIDRLAESGLVERRKGRDDADGRAVALYLTAEGMDLRRALMDSRLSKVEAALDGLTKEERGTLGVLLAKVLTNLPETEIDKHRICRLCDTAVCSDCPIRAHAI